MPIAAAPILLLCNANTPWGEYLGEILCTEGMPWFERVESWADVGARVGAESVLLIPHGDADAATVHAWVEAGGGVVAMRPDAELAALAGLEPLGRHASELPLLLEPPFDCGQARAHGEVDLCKLRDGQAHAHALCDGERFPAAVVRGRVAAFAYDLPHSVALTRQGNPEWTGERGTDLGSNTFRPADLFVRGCGAQTWLDFPSAGAPAADMQQRLLAYLTDRVSPRPLPRLWYLPDNKPTVLCVLGDSDGSDPEVIAEQLDDVAAAGGRMSSYMIDHSVDRSSAADVTRWRAAGHDISVHPDYARHGDKSVPNAQTMRLAQGTLIDRFRAKFGFSPRTLRNHSICWVGFAEQAEIERSLGIRLNAAYGYSSSFGDARYGGGAVGYLNGSGHLNAVCKCECR